MPKLILTIGISGSGKTEWAEDYISRNPSTVDIGRDIFRFDGSGCKSETEVSLKQSLAFLNSVKSHENIIVTDTNLSPTTRYKWYLRAVQHGLSIEYVVFNTHFDQVFNDTHAIMNLPDHVLHKQYPKFKEFLSETPKTTVTYSFV